VFAFEELENNLHPAAQRRLFRYLRKYAEKQGCCFFLTTHSNVVIDLFAKDDLAQLLHVSHDQTSSSVSGFSSTIDWWRITDDLGVRASDLMQTNAVIWVEGPSDRIYVNRWLELWSYGELIPGVHFQCLPYGGSVGSHFSFDDPDFIEDMIAALTINKNSIFIADRDRSNGEEV
jgi:putative ATP-dependent endonuclease of OLD family